MLPKQNRLNLRTDFKWVRSGSKLENNLVRIFIKYGDNDLPRVGIATPSVDFKKAIDRNRSRRLVSVGLGEVLPTLPSNINLLVFPKSGILNESSGKIAEELRQLFNEISSYKSN